ncbi:tetratricopeptide repeat protein [Streptomyces sp. NPDC014870]|uniref:tetratricopeptide repeat protein n=1 Tax=Streptomyces sp. NPDC014870 TaxID=3364925 RepID=UPI0036FCEE8C
MSVKNPQFEQAELLYGMGRYGESRERVARCVAEAPDDHHALVLLARCLIAEERHAEGQAAADAALVHAPDFAFGHYIRGVALRRQGRSHDAEEAMRETIRLDPEYWAPRAVRAELMPFVRDRFPGGDAAAVAEGLAEAQEAVRLGPEETRAWEALYKLALFNRRPDLADEAVRQLLRIDPTNTLAVTMATEAEAARPGTSAAQAADLYAGGLAAAPDANWLRKDLDKAVYRMLRGTRWLALLCLVMAGVVVDVFPTDGTEAKELPVHLGTRLWALALMAAVWGFGALRRYRRMRTGARMTVRDLVRRLFWPRVVLGQAVLATLCALLIVLVPWADRTVPQVLFWLGLVPNLLSITHDRNKV